MTQKAILEIQQALRLLSFYDARLIPIAVDGFYGQQTTEAVRIFQTLNGLQPTGEVDRATWAELRDSAGEKQYRKPLPLDVFFDADYVLSPGDVTITAGVIQLILQELSKQYSNIQTVNVSGIYDPETVQQVRYLQQLHNLEADGRVDLATWNILSTLFNNRFDTSRR